LAEGALSVAAMFTRHELLSVIPALLVTIKTNVNTFALVTLGAAKVHIGAQRFDSITLGPAT
jgi:hypothetical protein